MHHQGRGPGREAFETRVATATPAPTARPYYTLPEVALLVLGINEDWFYRTDVRERYYTAEGLPRPYCRRPMRFDRASVDAWKGRHHPARPPVIGAPANDTAAAGGPSRADLARHYAAARGER